MKPTTDQIPKRLDRAIYIIGPIILALGLFAILLTIFNKIDCYIDKAKIANNDNGLNSSSWPNLSDVAKEESHPDFKSSQEQDNTASGFNSTEVSIVKSDPQIFVENGYGEIKSIATQFLTVVISVIMISITFSEKIIDFKNSRQIIKYIFVTCLLLFISALISGGVGLVYNSFSYATALYHVESSESTGGLSFYESAFEGIKYIIFGGVLLGFGMGLIILTAVIEVFRK